MDSRRQEKHGFEIVKKAVLWGQHPSGVNYRQFGSFLTHVADWSQVPLEPGGFTPKDSRGISDGITQIESFKISRAALDGPAKGALEDSWGEKPFFCLTVPGASPKLQGA